MNFQMFQAEVEKINDPHLKPIFALIITALLDFPERKLKDVESFFGLIEALIGSEISKENLRLYLSKPVATDVDAWRHTSVSSLLEAFELMDLYRVPFQSVKDQFRKFES